MKVICISVLAAACLQAHAAPTEFTTFASWAAATVPVYSITFTSLADATIVSNQFSGLGVTFTDSDDTVLTSGAFVTDGKGINATGSTTLQFASAQSSIGFDFPGALHIDLYTGAGLVYSSSNFAGSGSGFFAGITGVSFDRVIVSDWADSRAFIDNVHVGAVPEPESYALLLGGLGWVGWTVRRRRA